MFGLGIPEIILIALGVGVLFFGSGKITEFARSMGRISGEFKKGKADVERELSTGEDPTHIKKNEINDGRESA
jgi:sec-independent protein translocase protein TatA